MAKITHNAQCTMQNAQCKYQLSFIYNIDLDIDKTRYVNFFYLLKILDQ